MPNLDIETLQKAVANPKQLHSIFDRVAIDKHSFNEHRRSPLPQVSLSADGLANSFLKLLETDLETDRERMEQHLLDSAHVETLPYLFQKYGWRIAGPNDTDKHPDAAFCDTFRAEKALAIHNPNSGYLLVKGDLTGIQEYIYHGIQAGKAGGLGNLTKRLRARSILVTLLTDFVANIILRELGLSSWHLLFAGGGHFNLLLPGDEETEVRLRIIAESLDKSMLAQFDDRLELIVSSVRCGTDVAEQPSQYFEAVNAERDRQKYQQHRKDLHDIFERKVVKSKKKEIRIGALFPRKHYLLEIVSRESLKYSEPENEADYRKDLILAEFDIHSYHTLLAVTDLTEAKIFLDKNKGDNIQSALILVLNNTDFLPREDWKTDFQFPVSFGFRFLGKNAPRPFLPDTELEDDTAQLLDFSQIAGMGQKGQQKEEGFVRLGSLMLDVDNLGLIFSHGLVGANLARVITLSRELNYFFTAHFNQRAQEKQYRVYVVYSGGDDAFAVGKWDMLMGFAKVLREDFLRFICYSENQNDDVHFSAGLFMSNPHYPLGRFYKDTKAAQEKAKQDDKNRVDVFDYTLDWSSYEDKFVLGNQFRDVLEKGQTNGGRKFNASFAYRVMQLVKSSYYERDGWENGQFVRRGKLRADKFSRNIARMHYLFARNGFSAEDSKKITDPLEKRLMHSFLKNAMKPQESGGFEARDYLVALNFAILQVRSSKNKTE